MAHADTTVSDELETMVAGRTLATAFLATVDAHADRVALRWQQAHGSGWAELTFAQYRDQVARVVTGLRALGVEPGDRVVLMLRNRPEFHVLDVASLFCGATPISIYNSSSPEQIAYCARHAGATAAIVDDAEFLGRFEQVQSDLPELRALAVLRPDEQPTPAAVSTATGPVTWGDLCAHDPADLDAAAAAITPEMLATVIYTSGTTGPPKGVMLDHHTVIFTTESLLRRLGRHDLAGMRVISYLPMAHIAERVVSHYNQILDACEVTTCPDLHQLATYLHEVKPTLFFGVPRVWEKLHAGVSAVLACDPSRKAKFDEGIEAAKPIARARAAGTATPEDDEAWMFFQDVGFRQVRELMGLDQVECAVSGAAPLAPDLLEWFRALGVPLSEIYGLSETCGPMTWEPDHVKPGWVGPALPGCEVRLAPDGEILCRGANIFRGYFGDSTQAQDVLDVDGWFHTGDVGEMDDDGFLRVIDRKKELIVTTGGKNISPANIEMALKMIPLVGQAFVVGDGHPYVAALLVLDPDVAPAWARSQGLPTAHVTDLARLARLPALRAEIETHVAEVMRQFSHAEQVKCVGILGVEWHPDSDELTPTSKLKRRAIAAKYADEIAALYSDDRAEA